MKKLLAFFLLMLGSVSVAHAWGFYGGFYGGFGWGGNPYYWSRPVVPYYVPPPVYVTPPPVYVAPPPPVVVVPQPRPPVVIDSPNEAPPGYRWKNLWDKNCNCNRAVLVPY